MTSQLFTRLVTIILALTLFATPLIFAPATPNYFTTPQLTFLFLGTLTLSILYVLYLLKNRELPVSSSPLRFPLALFALTTTLSLLTNLEARVESFFGLGLLFLLLTVLAYFATLLPSQNAKQSVANLFLISTSILAIHSILQLTLFHKLSFLPPYMESQAFTPTGSILTTITLLTISLVASLGSLSHSSSYHKVIRLIAATLSLIALIGHSSLMFSSSTLIPRLLPFQASWSLSLDSLKVPHNLALGTGFANFSTHFAANRPLFLNATPWWNLAPSTVSSELLQLLIVGGLPLLLSLLYLIFQGFRSSKMHTDPTLTLILATSTLSLALLPGSLPLYTLFFVALGTISATTPKKLEISSPTPLIFSLFISLTLVTLSYYFVQYLRAEMAINRATLALKNNDSEQVYVNTLRAARLLPQMTHYRLSSAQVNLSLAASLSQQKELSDAQKETISRLVSQAITEAKIATNLRPRDSRTWANLGNTYANLLTVAEGADQFALSAYAQAVALDPGNAVLRTEFGALLATLAQKTEDSAKQASYSTRASTELQTALQLRSDYAQAAYTLAKIRTLMGDSDTAIQILESLTKSLNPETPEYITIQKELNDLKTQSATPSGQAP